MGRGPQARTVDAHLVRVTSLVLLAPLVLLLFTTTRAGPLPAPALPPAFSAASAMQLTTELARDYPNRVPGSVGAARAAQWYEETLGLYGLAVTSDRWREDVAGLGQTDLVNLVTVIPGVVDDTIVVIAHRDNTGVSGGANDNASGTAALVELLRGYASTGTTSRRLEPSHTLVFVSSDAGAFGSLGAARFAATPLARRAVAVLSLDGIAGHARPRLEIAGPISRSPAPSLVRTASVRIGDQVGTAPAIPGLLTQLVDLGLPFGYGEQAAFLTAGRSALRLSTAPNAEDETGDEPARLDAERLGQLGRGAETTLASLDGAIQLSGRSAAFVYLGDRVARGWAVELFLLTALVPFSVGVIDLLVRAIRRGIRLRGGWRDLRRRCGLALAFGGLVFLGALTGLFPRGGPLPPPADAPPVDTWPVAGLLLLVVAAAALAVHYRRLAASTLAVATDELGGFAVAFTALGVIAAVVAIVNPFALLLLLPSLYTWIWLPAMRERPGWTADVLFGLGLAGPVLALVVLAAQLGLGPRTLLYAVGLATSGTTPWLLSLCTLLWAAVAAYVAALISSRGPLQPSDT
jgi:peptidase M28-like protein